jgi:hypothetical protein
MRNFVILCVLVAACGGDGDSIAFADYPEKAREALCSYLVRCGNIESAEACAKANLANLAANSGLAFDFRFPPGLAEAVAMGKVEFDGADAQACLDASAARSCDLTSQSSRISPRACATLVRGKLHDGDTCAQSLECVSGNCDLPACDDACCAGKCVGDSAPAAEAKIGESCEFTTCEVDAYCDDDLAICLARKDRDAPCILGKECNFGLDCVQGTCDALPALGGACSDTPCRDDGTVCSSTSHTCVAAGLAGASCKTDGDCSPVYLCDASRKCSAGPALGMPCAPDERCADAGAFCDVPASAAMGTCAMAKADGAACSTDDGCESAFCDPQTRRCAAEPFCI